MPPTSPTERRPSLLSRREVLAAGAGLLVAAACGGSDDDATGPPTSAGDATTGAVLLKLFDANRLPAGNEVRLPFGIGDADGTPRTSGPPELELGIATEEGELVTTLTAVRHGEGLPRSYYPVITTLPEPGIYRVRTIIDGAGVEGAIQVVPPSEAPSTPGPGDGMLPITTPTTTDPQGVDPICTRKPPCPLHDASLDDALQRGMPVAFLIATPAFCAVRICGPVVDVLAAELEAYGDRITMVHAEVFTNLEAEETTEAVKAYEIVSEPVLYLAGADGVIRRRYDVIFDRAELRAGLDSLLA